jgi:MFS family permease
MPVMAKDLNMSNDAIPWIISAFALSSGCLLLLFGRLADLYGRKLIWQIGVMWTIAMTIACALSRTSIQLIVFRALAGAGPAAMVPAALGILANSFPPSRARSTAFATFSGGSPVGAAFGIVLGGVITEYARYVLFMSTVVYATQEIVLIVLIIQLERALLLSHWSGRSRLGRWGPRH